MVVEKGQKPSFKGVSSGAGPKSVTVGCFTVEPASGVIHGRGLLMPRTQVVTVTMGPKNAGTLFREITFAVRRGRACKLRAQGDGTHDEAEEFQLPLKVL